MKALKKFNDVLERILTVIGVILLTIFIVVVFFEVITRNVIKIPILWSTEVSIMTFIWAVYLGAAIAVRKRRHYVVELFPEQNYKKLNMILDIIADVAIFGIIYVMIFNGYKYVKWVLHGILLLSLPQTYFSHVYLFRDSNGPFNIEWLLRDIARLAKLKRRVLSMNPLVLLMLLFL